METDRLTLSERLKEYAPFAAVILITAAVIGFVVAASSAHAQETTPAQGNGYIKQTVAYVPGDADLLPAVCGAGFAASTGCDDVYEWKPASVSNAVDYKVTVQSGFSGAAFFRTVIALEADADGNALTFLNANIEDFDWSRVPGTIEVDGVKYLVYVAVYKGSGEAANHQLAASAEVEVVSQIAMKSAVVSSQVAALGEGYNIMVKTQAVDAVSENGTEPDVSLLNSAFGEITADKHPWLESTGAAGEAADTGEELLA